MESANVSMFMVGILIGIFFGAFFGANMTNLDKEGSVINNEIIIGKGYDENATFGNKPTYYVEAINKDLPGISHLEVTETYYNQLEVGGSYTLKVKNATVLEVATE